MIINRKYFFYFISIAIAAALIYFLYLIRVKIARIISPFIIAIFISYMLMPLVKIIEKKVPRWVAILITYFLLAAIVLTVVVYVAPQITKNIGDLIIALPELTKGYKDRFNRLFAVIQGSGYPEEIKSIVLRQAQNSIAYIQGKIINVLAGVLDAILRLISLTFNFLIGIVISFYMMKDAEKIEKTLLDIFPLKWRNGIIRLFADINYVLTSFIQGQLAVAIIVGTLETIGLVLVGVKYPFILGAIGGIANIVPYFGPFIGSIPAVAVALLQSPVKALWTVTVFAIVQQIDNCIISPKIIGNGLGLHPITVIFSLIVGREFFGIIGMIFAVPIFSIIKIAGNRVFKSIV